MPIYVEVAINLSKISGSFHYHLPPELEESVHPGVLVIVPFGHQRVQGIVTRFITAPDISETKLVEDLVDEKAVLTPTQIALAHWMAEETLSPLGACINLMVPPGLSQQADILVTLNPEHVEHEVDLSSTEKKILNLLEKRGPLRGRQLNRAFQHVEWRNALRRLIRAGRVFSKSILPPPKVNRKTIRKVTLLIQPDQVVNLDFPLSKIERVQQRRMEILLSLGEENAPVEPSWLFAKTGGNTGDLKALEGARLIRILDVPTWRDPLEDVSYLPGKPPELTKDQIAAWEQIQEGLHAAAIGRVPKPFLLHGVTGSGKTEIYLRAVKETLAAGKRAMILVPEISLTPQTVKRFLSRFPGEVGVVHSQLSVGERYDTWRRVRSGELSVIVGPRSALFMPIEDLGLIVMDECHHESYDQQDSQPYYKGVSTGVACARLAGAAIILGSATPRVTQFYKAESKGWTYVSLPQRILAHRETIAHHAQRLGLDITVRNNEGDAADLGLPEVSIVDMRRELHTGNRSIFSRALQSAIEHVLNTNQQAILFLNRRGTATYVFCRDCGYVVKCARCDKPLTFHSSHNQLLCHTCGYQRNVPKVCPGCGGNHIRQLGMGTERVEKLVQERFPGVRTLRWDAETTQKKGAHDQILTLFSNQSADILIGTQMLAKGLDLPLVTLVGVILSETGLNLPDYRATERTFQVLTQVAGRAGRSPLGGKVIFQTYQPENYAIQNAARHDFRGFYKKEMVYRRELGYPPYTRLVRLEYRHYDPIKAESIAKDLAAQLREWIAADGEKIEMIGPVPCFFSRVSGRYRWQIVLSGKEPSHLLRDQKLPDWIIEVDPSSLL